MKSASTALPRGALVYGAPVDGSQEWFTRKEASIFLGQIGCPVAPQTLANMAANCNAGKGPPFTSAGWRTVRYRKVDLEAWAQRKSSSVL